MKQHVVLNGPLSLQIDIEARDPQGSILKHFFFSVYIKDLPNNLTSESKVFIDDKSLFQTVADPNTMRNRIDNDLHNIDRLVYL